jgi:hypothetical protein
MDTDDLERLTGQKLRSLPPPRAPRTLLPRVMDAVRHAARPWYQRAWFTWPAGWQAASVAALLVLVAALSTLGPVADARSVEVLTSLDRTVVEPAASMAEHAATVMRAAAIMGRTANEALFGVLPLLFLIMLATTVVLGATIGRVAMGRVHQS